MEEKRKRIVVFSKGDDKFIKDIVERLSIQYDTKKITINTLHDLKPLERWMQWADICWFEWCDELLIYASKLDIAKEKIIICRLHSYEAFTNYPAQVNWNRVDRLIFISETIRKYVIDNFKIDKNITIVIPNGVNMSKYSFRQGSHGFNVAYIGYINYKKGPMLLLQTFRAIHDCDKRYRFYIAGQFQDPRYSLYFKQMVRELGLTDNYFFDGWQNDIDRWLEDKNYIICSSVLESQNMSVMQAMAKGIKPVIHNFVGAEEIYPDKYLWNTVDEAVAMVTGGDYDSQEYRRFVEEYYSIDNRFTLIKALIEELENKDKTNIEFNYKEYWNRRLNSKFNIEGVGYNGLGEIYNGFLYRNRIDMLDHITSNLFDNIGRKRVLELGPGTGIFTELFSNKKVENYEAVDISEKSATELRKSYPEYTFRQGDISDETQYVGKYDLIFAADVLLHITNENEYKKVIRNISNHLEDNGVCIMYDPISVMDTKSESIHMVIRSRGYVERLLEEYGLSLEKLLPISYFMNYPFDRNLIGSKGEHAQMLFDTVTQIFRLGAFSDEELKSIGEYLILKDRQLLCSSNIGLSEKLLIIKRKENKNESRFNLKEFYDKERIKEDIAVIEEKLRQNQKIQQYFVGKVKVLLNRLEIEENPDFEYIRNKMSEFISYNENDFDKYDYSNTRILIGKREKSLNGYELIEFILENSENEKLIINNIWFDIFNNRFIMPGQIENSKHSEEIRLIAKKIHDSKLGFINNVAGFVFDPVIRSDVEKNSLAYIWERGIPASQYLPLYGYLRIAERYTFAAGYMNNDSNVLEAPCGFGYGAAYFSKICRNVEALDIAEENIVFAKQAFRQPNIHWTKGDVTCLPFKAEEFDVYVSYEVFEHLPEDMTIKHIQEAYRVLKNSGKFIISTPNRAMRKNVHNPFHIKEYEFGEFSSILKEVFDSVEFYSVRNFQVEKGMQESAIVMIAVCEKGLPPLP